MAPPALVIAGSIVVVAGVTVAFHQFVYAPHIAPKLEVFIDTLREKHRAKRPRITPAAYTDSEDDGDGSPHTGHELRSVEMKDISIPLRTTGREPGVSETTLRKRTNATPLERSFNLRPAASPLVLSGNDEKHRPAATSRSSTPSTFSSSILAAQSPLIGTGPLSSPADQSPNPLADSILADPAQSSLSTPSPAHSITHISPRTISVALPPLSSPVVHPFNPSRGGQEYADSDEEEDNRPLAEINLQNDTIIHYPVLSPSIHIAGSSLGSPTGSTVYQSFRSTPLSSSSPSPLIPPLEIPRADSAQDGTPVFPLRSNSFTASDVFLSAGQRTPLSAGQRTPHSTTSWSEAALSENSEEPEFLVGSDVESWASVSDASRDPRRPPA